MDQREGFDVLFDNVQDHCSRPILFFAMAFENLSAISIVYMEVSLI